MAEMQECPGDRDPRLDEELADVLTAISVVSRRLAKKLRAINGQPETKEKGGTENEQNE